MGASEAVRKKSPRAPSIPLGEAIDKAIKVYEKERLHPAPADVVAQHMGYKDANSGRSLSAIASLRYYGLLQRHGNGLLSITKDVEGYKFAPNDQMQRAYLRRFVTTPSLFAELIDRYAAGLPSDGKLRYELIQRGFLPSTAEVLVGVLRRSVEFAKVNDQAEVQDDSEVVLGSDDEMPYVGPPVVPLIAPPISPSADGQAPSDLREASDQLTFGHDRIPVRLSGGRRAWLLIPPVFREADKQRLKAQIDLLLTEDDEACA